VDLVVRANVHVTDTRVTPGAVPFVGTVEQVADEIATYADAGAHHLHLDLQYSEAIETAAMLLDTAERIHARARSVIAGHASPLAVGGI
jgi:alkanesulfonate monooxygenase SsuD/methylene tetrahydromethanopterin reductase-like flavin-dependent oxidoreductase (luciferase family)